MNDASVEYTSGLVHPPDISQSPKISRRTFLRRGAETVGAGILATQIFPNIILDGILSSTVDGMDTQIPEEFKNIDVPTRNEYFIKPETILQQAFDQYSTWRKQTDLPPISFQPRESYLNLKTVVEKFPEVLKESPSEDGTVFSRLSHIVFAIDLKASIDSSVKGEIFSFSFSSINGIADLIADDPGSGLVGDVMNSYLQTKNWSRQEFYEKLAEGQLTPEDFIQIGEPISSSLNNALEYFTHAREIESKPLSCSNALAYFLYQNSGDLYKSMVDTTLFFKVMVRNNFYTFEANPNYDQAKRISYLFKDQFSPHMSLNWLVDQFETGKIPKNSPLYEGSPFASQRQKDFMPINRDGVYYHCFNLMTLATVCMDPFLAKSMVSAYYDQKKIGGEDYVSEHGAEKVSADIEVIRRADELKQTVERNIK